MHNQLYYMTIFGIPSFRLELKKTIFGKKAHGKKHRKNILEKRLLTEKKA